jgi:hypothetical protein
MSKNAWLIGSVFGFIFNLTVLHSTLDAAVLGLVVSGAVGALLLLLGILK